jgi:uncharacterized protein (TIGR03790 family)
MYLLRCRPLRIAGFFLLISVAPLKSLAGGSGFNTVVVVNQNSANSRELANYFCERRQVPAENVLRISWPGGNISWSSNEFRTLLLDPLLAMLSVRQLTNQVDCVVLSMDIPFQTTVGTAVNGTTSALFYGLKGNTLEERKSVTNSYAASEQIFRYAKPASATGPSFLATMITSDSLANAKKMIDQGVDSDATFPTQPIVLAKSSDVLRNVRYTTFDNAIFNTRIRGHYSLYRTNSDSPYGQSNLLGYQTGLAAFSISPNTFVPGAIADSLTSYAGVIFGPNGQTTLLAFINAGAAGSYGTVTEPSPDLAKFPDPQIYFYQSRGFSLAECYYQSLAAPYQGLIVAEPLAAPFARPGSGQWQGINPNAMLSGTAQLAVQFSAAGKNRPLQRVDLFLDGKYLRTLTNLPPLPGNQLKLTLNGYPLTYTVPANSTISSIAAGLATLINSPGAANAGLNASVRGDRIDLRLVSAAITGRPASPSAVRITLDESSENVTRQAPLFVNSAAGSAPTSTTFAMFPRSVLVNSPATATRACIISGTIQPGAWVQLTVTKANGASIGISATNQSATATPFDLATQLVTRINATPALQSADGIIAEDCFAIWTGAAGLTVRARTPGREGAYIKIMFTGSSSFVFSPATEVELNANMSDLQPRNHLYITAGASSLAFTFPLDTTSVADGFHELAAVAYEGSHVATQTRIVLPVRVQNSSLSGTLSLLDLADQAPAQGVYHIQVAANTNNISTIRLFSTGGVLSSVTNQASATFTVDASTLGAGLHPFHAVIESLTGRKYRTETRWVRLTP